MTDAETVQPRSVHEVRPIDLGEGSCTGEEGFCGVHGYHRHPVDGD